MGIRMALAVIVSAVLLGLLRNIWLVPFELISGKPIRIDIPLPTLPIDVVLVSNPDHIKVRSFLQASDHCACTLRKLSQQSELMANQPLR